MTSIWSTLMLPSPLHPALVHFPVGLMLFLPLAAAGALVAIRRGAAPLKAWAVPVVLAALLAVSAFAAVETGESEDHRVEDVVAEPALATHEDAGKRFLLFSGVVLVLMTAGLLGGPGGRVARTAGLVGALALTVAGYQVGHSGGRLVYGDETTQGLVGSAPGGESRDRSGGRAGPESEVERDHD
jgi:uncharacterized membrane protein